jgi:hypothetical protein
MRATVGISCGFAPVASASRSFTDRYQKHGCSLFAAQAALYKYLGQTRFCLHLVCVHADAFDFDSGSSHQDFASAGRARAARVFVEQDYYKYEVPETVTLAGIGFVSPGLGTCISLFPDSISHFMLWHCMLMRREGFCVRNVYCQLQWYCYGRRASSLCTDGYELVMLIHVVVFSVSVQKRWVGHNHSHNITCRGYGHACTCTLDSVVSGIRILRVMFCSYFTIPTNMQVFQKGALKCTDGGRALASWLEVLQLLGGGCDATAAPGHRTERNGMHGVWLNNGVVVFKGKRCLLFLTSLFFKELNGETQGTGLQFGCLIWVKEGLRQRRHASVALDPRHLKSTCTREDAQDDDKNES